MRYFLDTEFIEDFTRPWIGKSRHYIDLISIGIVAEDGREYYAVSNEFDINHVWNKYQLKPMTNIGGIGDTPTDMKVYWLRDNVLKPIHKYLLEKEGTYGKTYHPGLMEWSKLGLRNLIKWHGKSNKQIAQEITRFVMPSKEDVHPMGWPEYHRIFSKPELYGYYSAYDHVLLCSLYGRMLDLPKGFPMYTRDLKQMYDERSGCGPLKSHPTYPKPSNEHNALDDARWNKKLYDFIQTA